MKKGGKNIIVVETFSLLRRRLKKFEDTLKDTYNRNDGE